MYGMNQGGMDTGGMYPGMPNMNPSPFQYPAPSTFNGGMGQTSSAQLLQPQEQPFDGLTRVTGMQGAKAYRMPANSRAALFDDTDDIVIIKMTDGAGFPSYKRARLDWLPDEPENDFMTRAEFRKELEDFRSGLDELKGLILSNGKQSVRKLSKSGDTSDSE